MKKVIHRLRNKPEEERRHILHITVFVAAVIIVILWTFSLGKSISNPDTKIKIKQDLQPFSALKSNMVGGFNSITGQNGETGSSTTQ